MCALSLGSELSGMLGQKHETLKHRMVWVLLSLKLIVAATILSVVSSWSWRRQDLKGKLLQALPKVAIARLNSLSVLQVKHHKAELLQVRTESTEDSAQGPPTEDTRVKVKKTIQPQLGNPLQRDKFCPSVKCLRVQLKVNQLQTVEIR